jgi:hypothetical protein
MTSIRHKFLVQRNKAAERGIVWRLSYEQWFDIWEKSGHLHERGKRRGEYVMCRYGDTGPYAVGNVRIATVTENQNEMDQYERTAKHRRIAIQNLPPKDYNIGRKHSAETRAKLSAAKMGSKNPFYGRKHSAATRAKMSAAQHARQSDWMA